MVSKHCWLMGVSLVLAAMMLVATTGQAQADAHEDKASDQAKRVVFVAGSRSHGYGEHSHRAGCMLLADLLQKHHPDIKTKVYTGGWPSDAKAFKGADSIVMYNDGGGGHMVLNHLKQVDKLADKGVGIVALHYGVEVPKGKAGDHFLKWIGGYFETHYSLNPYWTAKYKNLPDHPITRGVPPFSQYDEWYYHMRFKPNMPNTTPILSDLPPKETLLGRGWSPGESSKAHHGNQHAYDAVVKEKKPQHTAWAKVRPDGGRGFGCTGGHYHWGWAQDDFRTLVLNAIAWTAHAEVPESGLRTPTPSAERMMENLDYDKPGNVTAKKIQKKIRKMNRDKLN